MGTGEHVINMNLKRKKSIFIPMRCLTTCSFSEVLFLKEVGHWEQVNSEHVINMNLKRKKSIFIPMRCLTTCSFSEVLFLKEVGHCEQVNR